MPRVEITESVCRTLHIAKCPCCGSSDSSASSGYTHMDGEGYGSVQCEKCGHKVSEQRYGWSDSAALAAAIRKWNSQSQEYGGTNDDSREIAKLRKVVAEKDSVIRILKAMLASGQKWEIDPSITDARFLEQFSNVY